MISFDGDNKSIILSESSYFSMSNIYIASVNWSVMAENMKYIIPMTASSELLYTLQYGWKIKPAGYADDSTITVSGKITTTEGDGEQKTLPQDDSNCVNWQFDTPATVVLVSSGSGLSTEEHDKLMELKNPSLLVRKKII